MSDPQQQETRLSMMERLPAELHVEISRYLNPSSIINLARTNKEMHSIYAMTDAYRGSLLTESIIRIIQEDLPLKDNGFSEEHDEERFIKRLASSLLPFPAQHAVQANAEERKKDIEEAHTKARRIKKRSNLILDLGRKPHTGNFEKILGTNVKKWITNKIFWELVYALLIAPNKVNGDASIFWDPRNV